MSAMGGKQTLAERSPVELRRRANDAWTRTDDEDGADVSTAGH